MISGARYHRVATYLHTARLSVNEDSALYSSLPCHLVLGGPRQSEVEDLQLAVLVHCDVGGLQIPGKYVF